MFETKSNDTGYYFFKVESFQGIGELTIATDKNTSFINSKSYGFLASNERDTLNFNHSKKHIKDFKVKRIITCGLEIPYIYFKYNSIEPYKFYANDSLNNPSSNEVVDIYYSVLIEDPTITILIEGHCDSREKNADTLSLTRANYMRKALIDKGIDKERVITKGWGSKKPIVKNEVINNATTKQEKENLYLKNRRISYRVANWDYSPKENNKSSK